MPFDREAMLADRDIITEKIGKYMTANGYSLSPKSKNYHALDSFVYEYVNCGGATAECASVEKHPMALWKCRSKV